MESERRCTIVVVQEQGTHPNTASHGNPRVGGSAGACVFCGCQRTVFEAGLLLYARVSHAWGYEEEPPLPLRRSMGISASKSEEAPSCVPRPRLLLLLLSQLSAARWGVEDPAVDERSAREAAWVSAVATTTVRIAAAT